MIRTPSHHESDARRVVKGRDVEWLQGYIARQALKMIVADQELRDHNHESMLSQGLREALLQLRNYAGKTTGRQRVRLTQ